MQVDGSLGMTAAITEMLMQSQDAVINLLPALPDEWTSGEFRGVRTRGGFELDFQWKDKRVTPAKSHFEGRRHAFECDRIRRWM